MNLATLDVDIKAVTTKLAELSSQFETLARDASKKGNDAAKEAASRVKQEIATASEELKKLQRVQSELVQSSARATELFRKGIGGGEAAEKIKAIADAWGIYKNKQNEAGARADAHAAALGMIGRMAFGAATQIVHMAQQVMEATAKLDEHQRHLDALGSSYAATRAATDGAMSATDAFAVREQNLAQNLFLTDQQTATLNRRMREFAVLHGGEATSAMQRFSQAVQAGDNNALAQFGVRINATIPAAERMTEALRQLAEQQRHQPIIPETANERARTFTQTLDQLGGALISSMNPLAADTEYHNANARAVAAGNRAREEHRQRILAEQAAQDRLNHSLLDAKRVMHDIVHAITNEQNRALASSKTLIDSITHSVTEYTAQLNLASNASQRLAFNADLAQQGLNQNESRMSGLRQAIQNRRSERESNRSLVHEALREGYTRAELVEQGLLANATGQTVQELKRTTAELLHQIEQLGGASVDMDRRRGESRAHFYARYEEHARGALRHLQEELEITRSIEDHQRALLQVLREEKALKDADVTTSKEAIESTVRAPTTYTKGQGASAESDYGVLDPEQMRQLQEAQDFSTQFANVFAANTEHAATMAQSFSATVSSSVGTATGALKSHFQAWLTGKETIGQAAQAILHDVLLTLATESAVKAIFQYGEGIASLAMQNYAGAAQHFAAGAIYTAVAVAAGAGAAVTVPTPASAATGAGNALPPAAGQASSPTSSQSGDRPNVTVIYSGSTYGTREELHDSMITGVNEALRRGAMLEAS